jgi:hypothetical protein
VVIVRRETSLAARLVQPVRMPCVQCHLSFVALAERSYVASETDTSWFANADARRERVLQKLATEATRSISAGLGECPYCGFRFPYLEPPGRALLVGVRVAKGLVIGWVLGWLVGALTANTVSLPDLLPALIGAALGAAVMAWGAITVDLAPRPATDTGRPAPAGTNGDPRVMTEEAWGEFLRECQSRHLEPVREWWYGRLGRRTSESEVFVPMTFHDYVPVLEEEAGRSPVPLQVYVLLRRWWL